MLNIILSELFPETTKEEKKEKIGTDKTYHIRHILHVRNLHMNSIGIVTKRSFPLITSSEIEEKLE